METTIWGLYRLFNSALAGHPPPPGPPVVAGTVKPTVKNEIPGLPRLD